MSLLGWRVGVHPVQAAEGYDGSGPGGTASGKPGTGGVTAPLGAVGVGLSSAATSSGLLNLQKKLTELELALAQCQKVRHP